MTNRPHSGRHKRFFQPKIKYQGAYYQSVPLIRLPHTTRAHIKTARARANPLLFKVMLGSHLKRGLDSRSTITVRALRRTCVAAPGDGGNA